MSKSSDDQDLISLESPPSKISREESPRKLEDGISLCLSGGGYRAMLFHVGAVIRLNELGILSKIRRISSVSGGSITSAALGMAWDRLKWNANWTKVDEDSLRNDFVQPVRKMADNSIDVSSVGWGALSPFSTISEQVSKGYSKYLFGKKSLQDLPDERKQPVRNKNLPPAPRFVFVATNVKTGSLWRFSKPYMADFRVGRVDRPRISLADVVTASSAFPPFLSPFNLNLDAFKFVPGIPDNASRLPRSFRADAVLTDGGVYDNLGLEPLWKRYSTVLVSDGGRRMEDDLSPHDDWARHSRRLIDLLMHQVTSLRRRQIIEAFKSNHDPHAGAYWGIQTNIMDFGLKDSLNANHGKTLRIANIATRLAAMEERQQELLINWGYAICDAAIRKYQSSLIQLPSAPEFPYPRIGVG